jgi:hypothetical protein
VSTCTPPDDSVGECFSLLPQPVASNRVEAKWRGRGGERMLALSVGVPIVIIVVVVAIVVVFALARRR